MSSVALYRRWRPQTFADVLGQEHVVATLQAAIRDDRAAHAYLFTGPRGTGKTSLARILAKALNCEKAPGPEPCNACDSCAAITAGSSLDVIEIDAATHGGVDDVRELRENALLAPAASRRKIYILDEAHMITAAGWNAFLKTVEEPPPHVLFVFATTEPHKVLATISSRCQRFDFRRVSTRAIAERLAAVCAEEKIEAEPAALHLIARASEGGVRDALATLDQLGAAGAVSVDSATRLLGTAGGAILFEFCDALAARDTAQAIEVIGRLVEEGRDLRVFVRQMLEHLRSLFLAREAPEAADLIDVTDETRAEMQAQADRFAGAAHLIHLLRLFMDAQADMRQQAAPRLALEVAAVRATVPEADDSAQAALARVERLERLLQVGGDAPPQGAPTQGAPDAKTAGTPDAKTAGTPAAKTAGTPAAKTAGTPDAAGPAGVGALLDLEKVRRSWPVALEAVRNRSQRIYALLGETRPVALEGGTLTLEARYPFHAQAIIEAGNAAVIGEALREVFGAGLAVVTRVADAPAADDGEPAGDVDPLEALRTSFGAEVIEEEA